MCDGILDPESFWDRDLARDSASCGEIEGGLRERPLCSGSPTSADSGAPSEDGPLLDLGTIESTFSESKWSSGGLVKELSGCGLKSAPSGDRDKGVIVPMDAISQNSPGRVFQYFKVFTYLDPWLTAPVAIWEVLAESSRLPIKHPRSIYQGRGILAPEEKKRRLHSEAAGYSLEKPTARSVATRGSHRWFRTRKMPRLLLQASLHNLV